MTTNTKYPELLDPWLADLHDRSWLGGRVTAGTVEPTSFGGCWNCGRLDCPEPDGESCHAYVASVEIPDEEIPF